MLQQKPPAELLVGGLDGHFTSQARVAGTIRFAHPSGTDGRVDLVRAKIISR